MHEGLDRAGRLDPADRHIRCVLAFGQFEYLAERWLRTGWEISRAVCLRNLTDAWCDLLTA